MKKTNKKIVEEHKFGHGGRPVSVLKRKLHKAMRRKIARAGMPFDWEKGYDVRDVIGKVGIKDQGSNSSCGGQAGSYFLEMERKLRNVAEKQISAKSIYAHIAYPGGGTTVQALLQQIGTAGALNETEVPSYYVTGEPLSESMMIEKSWVTSGMVKKALMKAGYTVYDIGENMETVAETIRDYGPVMWMIKGQNNSTWTTESPKPPTKGNGPVWHHFMVVVGAKMINGKKTLIALQSWGTKVGNKGEQYFTQEYFDAKGIVDAFTLIHNSRVNPMDSNKSIWAEIARWFKRQEWFS